MQTGIFSHLGRVLEQHSAAISLPVFLVGIVIAYWVFAVAPYRESRPGDLRSPDHICRPAVPGVLEYWPGEPAGSELICEPPRTSPPQRMETNHWT